MSEVKDLRGKIIWCSVSLQFLRQVTGYTREEVASSIGLTNSQYDDIELEHYTSLPNDMFPLLDEILQEAYETLCRYRLDIITELAIKLNITPRYLCYKLGVKLSFADRYLAGELPPLFFIRRLLDCYDQGKLVDYRRTRKRAKNDKDKQEPKQEETPGHWRRRRHKSLSDFWRSKGHKTVPPQT